MSDINYNKEIWEGWTIKHFIEYLEPMFVMEIQKDERRFNHRLSTKEDVKKWCMNNQPYYKKVIPEVVQYFVENYNFK